MGAGPSTGVAPTPSFGTAPLISASCAPGGTSFTIVAKNIRFSTNCLAMRANTPFRIAFENRDAGVNHNVEILPRPFGYNTPPTPSLFGRIVKGPVTVTYRSSGLPAGLLFMSCYVHHDVMFGLVGVAPQATPVTGKDGMTFHVAWATANDAPDGYFWNVQIRRPGSSAFVDWKLAQSGLGADFIPDAGPGTYSFRVWQYHPPTSVLGYSPAVSITVD
jgi:hypothetical protein